MYYLEAPRKRKTYEQIAHLENYAHRSGARKVVKRVRLKFLELFVFYELEELYQKEMGTKDNFDLTPDDLTTAK